VGKMGFLRRYLGFFALFKITQQFHTEAPETLRHREIAFKFKNAELKIQNPKAIGSA
jgi:hypothetical protein